MMRRDTILGCLLALSTWACLDDEGVQEMPLVPSEEIDMQLANASSPHLGRPLLLDVGYQLARREDTFPRSSELVEWDRGQALSEQVSPYPYVPTPGMRVEYFTLGDEVVVMEFEHDADLTPAYRLRQGGAPELISLCGGSPECWAHLTQSTGRGLLLTEVVRNAANDDAELALHWLPRGADASRRLGDLPDAWYCELAAIAWEGDRLFALARFHPSSVREFVVSDSLALVRIDFSSAVPELAYSHRLVGLQEEAGLRQYSVGFVQGGQYTATARGEGEMLTLSWSAESLEPVGAGTVAYPEPEGMQYIGGGVSTGPHPVGETPDRYYAAWSSFASTAPIYRFLGDRWEQVWDGDVVAATGETEVTWFRDWRYVGERDGLLYFGGTHYLAEVDAAGGGLVRGWRMPVVHRELFDVLGPQRPALTAARIIGDRIVLTGDFSRSEQHGLPFLQRYYGEIEL